MQYLSRRLESKRSRRGNSPRDVVAARRRERLLTAAERLVAACGYAATTIGGIAKEARVSTVSFYEIFESKEECFEAAFDRAVEETRARVAEAPPAGAAWPEQVREGLRALLSLIEANPDRARMCLVEAPRGGPALLARYEAALARIAPKLREGRLLDPAAAGLAESLEEATIGGIAWLLRENLEAGNAEDVGEMLPQLLDIALSPYLGPREALSLAAVTQAD